MEEVRRERPRPDEYSDFYAGYIALVDEENVVNALGRQMQEAISLLRSIPEDRETFRYGPEKWSIRQVVGHLVDAERVFGSRAHSFSRGESAELPGFDENSYVANGPSHDRPLAAITSELEHLRSANILLFESLPDSAWLQRGLANGHAVSVRALAWITAGHARHHIRVLEERYLRSPDYRR